MTIPFGTLETDLSATFRVSNKGPPSFVYFEMAAHMLIFPGEIRRRSKKLKVLKLLTSNHKLLTAV